MSRQGRQGIRGADDRAEPALADRLHLSQGYRLSWFDPSTILDDYSRFIIAWKLCTSMRVGDATRHAGVGLGARVVHKPRRLSDNGASYVAGDIADWLEGKGMTHIRGAPNHPQTQADQAVAPPCERRSYGAGVRYP